MESSCSLLGENRAESEGGCGKSTLGLLGGMKLLLGPEWVGVVPDGKEVADTGVDDRWGVFVIGNKTLGLNGGGLA